ncbi:MAG: hypothetical protein ACJATI_004708, partial [Halioglobus sp.]
MNLQYKLIGIILFLANIIYAQSGQELIDQQIPNSPEVSDVFKYNPAQNNLFRGNVGLTIPLPSATSDNLSLAGSLSYQSSGIKVNSIASQVGAEWQVNMGGAISRVVKDRPDDAFKYHTDLRQCMRYLNCYNCFGCPSDGSDINCTICEEENNDGTYKYILINEENIGYLYNGETIDELAKKENYSNEERVFIGGDYFNLLIELLNSEVDGTTDITVDVDNAGLYLTYDVLRPTYDINDTEPDDFAFNFNGYSGRFVFDKNGEAKVFSHQDIKIEYTLDQEHEIQPSAEHDFDYSSNYKGAITEFKVTTPDGVKYYFDAKEISFSNSELQLINNNNGMVSPVCECSPPLKNPYRVEMEHKNAAYTNWKLTRVETPTATEAEGYDEIRLTYDDTFLINHSNYSQTQSYSCTDPDPDTGESEEALISESRNSTVEYTFGKQLNKIEWKKGGSYANGGNIDLLYEDDREDLYYPSDVVANMGDLLKVQRLSEIQHYPSGGLKSKAITFSQSYFNKLYTNCTDPELYQDAHSSRLRLDAVTITGWGTDGASEAMPPYIFTYNDTPLPPRHSPKQDYWGYYNGVEKMGEEQSLIGKTFAYFAPSPQSYSDTELFRSVYSILDRKPFSASMVEVDIEPYVTYGSREPRIDYTKAGILEEVEFPTGAINQFDYEPNIVGNPVYEDGTVVGGIRLSKITDSKGLIKTYDYSLLGFGGTTSSSGYISDLPQFASSSRKGNCFTIQSCDGDVNEAPADILHNTTLHSSPVNASIGGFDIGYTKVTEKLGTEGKEEAFGKTVFVFSFDENLILGKTILPDFEFDASSDECYNEDFYKTPHVYNSFCRTYQDFHPFPPLPNVEWKKGLLELKTVYDSDKKVVLTEDPEYEMVCAKKIYGIKSTNNRDVSSFYEEIIDRSNASYYYLSGDIRMSTNTTEYTYDGGVVTEKKEYFYNPNNTQPFQINHFNGATIEKTESFIFANSPTNENALLKDNFMIGIPLRSAINVGYGGATRTTYGNFNNRILVDKIETYGHNNENSQDPWREAVNVISYSDYGKISLVKSSRDVATRIINRDERGNLDNMIHGHRVWDYDFDKFNRLEKIKDYNDKESVFGYDPLGRLNLKSTNNNRIKNEYTYVFDDEGYTVSATLSTLPNGLGFTTEMKYDAFGREITNTKLGYLDGGGNLNITKEYDVLNNILIENDPTKGIGFTEYVYKPSPLSRLDYIMPAGSPKKVEIDYEAGNNNHVVVTIDEDGLETKVYTDVFGRQTKTIDGLGNETVYTYNDRDQVLTINPPMNAGGDYVYSYYDGGALKTKTIPDKGSHLFSYNDHDQVITEELPNGKIITNNYHATYNDFLISREMGGHLLEHFIPLDPSYVQDFIGEESYSIHWGEEETESILGQRHEISHTEIDKDFGRSLSQSISTLDGSYIMEIGYDDLGNMKSQAAFVNAFGINKSASESWTFQNGIREKNYGFLAGQLSGGSKKDYNGNDWLVNKKLGSILQDIKYEYNPRGWLKKINAVGSVSSGGNIKCNELEPPVIPDFDCENLLDLINTFIIHYDCEELSDGSPTDIEIEVSSQSFENGLLNGLTIESIEIPINGGAPSESTLSDEFAFNLNDLTTLDDVSLGIYNLLLDCILQNPDLLPILEDLINQGLVENLSPIIEGYQELSGPEEPPTSTPASPPVFGMEIFYYEENEKLDAISRYNGNISWMKWKTIGDHVHTYGFTYDDNNRLTKALYGEISLETECELIQTDKYSVPDIGYDDLGNILSVTRKGLLGSTPNTSPTYDFIDLLTYVPSSGSPSIMQSIIDASEVDKGFKGGTAQYSYANGNMTYASNKTLSTVYSYNDLPIRMKTPKDDIINYYTSSGIKLKSMLLPTSEGNLIPKITNYFANQEYENSELKAVKFHHVAKRSYDKRLDLDEIKK